MSTKEPQGTFSSDTTVNTKERCKTITPEGGELYKNSKLADKSKVDKEAPYKIQPADDSSLEHTDNTASIQGEQANKTEENEPDCNTLYKPSPYDQISYPQPLKKSNKKDNSSSFLKRVKSC